MIVYSALFHPACISLDEGNDNSPMHWILPTDSMHYDTTDIEALDRQASDFIVEDAEKIRIPLLFQKTKITVDLVKSAEKNACGQRQNVLEAHLSWSILFLGRPSHLGTINWLRLKIVG